MEGSSKGKRGSGKRSKVSVTRVGAGLGDKYVMATIVGESGGEPETADTMMGP